MEEHRKETETKENDKSSMIRDIADFLSTFFVALVVMIAVVLVVGRVMGMHMFNVESGSMSPAYPVNSLVLVKETDPADIMEGDVITFVMNEEGMLVTHRVVSVNASERTFTTKGDANNVEDAKPVLWDNTVGKVLIGIPMVGKFFAVITAEANRKIMIGIIAGLLLSSFIWDITKKKDKGKSGKRERSEAEKMGDEEIEKKEGRKK